jgi:type 1 fimbriae regulatory protein FimB/type 1 fimbriae regulatory protein FimE
MPPPRKPRNADVRSREHLTPDEVERLIRAAGRAGRNGHRDATIVLVAYRHGLRVGELVALRWDQVHLDAGEMHVRRSKRGKPATHPIDGQELRALRRLRRESIESPFVFVSEQGGPLDPSVVRKVLRRAGDLAGLEMPVHPHMLRHATGYALANRGVDTRTIQAYLGHINIQHTVRYTELAPGRFKSIWGD